MNNVIIDAIYSLTAKKPTLPELNFTKVTFAGKTYISPLEFLKISVRRNLIARTLDFKLTGIYMDDYIPKHLNKKPLILMLFQFPMRLLLKYLRRPMQKLIRRKLKPIRLTHLMWVTVIALFSH